MKALLNKEFKLCLHPTNLIFLSMALMLLIPSYPYYVAFFYTTLGIFFMFITGRETGDVVFSALLPIRKRDIVKARVVNIAIIEAVQLIISVPFALLGAKINPYGFNAVGMEANAAFFGLVMIMFTVFNISFIPAFYRTAHKAGGPFALGSTLVFIYIVAAEGAVNLLPFFKNCLDNFDAAYLPLRLGVLSAGIVIWALGLFAAFKKAAANFEKVDI
ncbi:MAG: hypothetical protein GX061_08690 [Eubacteriaceae bacterium]|nr:hypothetical protein [Eubacteriaceae bacterium]